MINQKKKKNVGKKIIGLVSITLLFIVIIMPVLSSKEIIDLNDKLSILNGPLNEMKNDTLTYKIYSTSFENDKFELKIIRYKPVKNNKTTICKYPVVLCHGLLANKHSLDFDEKDSSDWENYSLAAYLSNPHGERPVSFDVWVPELRGIRSLNKNSINNIDNNISNFNWSFDDYVDKDMPSIIRYIQEIYEEEGNNTGNRPTPVFWIGMSMGGMLAYAYGETNEGYENLKGVITIGSPVAFEYNHKWYTNLLKLLVPTRIGLPINPKVLLENIPGAIEIMKKNGGNPENINESLYEKYVKLGLDNYLSSKILSHFSIFFSYKDFCRYPKNPTLFYLTKNIPLIKDYMGPESYKKNLFKFKSPLLAISGGKDYQAPPEEVKYAIDNVGSSDATYMEFSKDSEYTDIDYGHLDFHLGKKVKDEFYPQIYKWLTLKI